MDNLDIDLVLEGGGTRCSFTNGVLDYLMGHNIGFETIYGVSAGSLAGALFLSGQKGFLKEVYNKMNQQGIPATTSGPANMYKLLTYIDTELVSFDYKSFSESRSNFYICVLNANTGLPEYIDGKSLKNKDSLFKCLAASCSVPGKFEPIRIDGSTYFDGGYYDPIPLLEAISKKSNKKMIVLTQDLSYYKDQEFVDENLAKNIGYEKVVRAMESRHINYNQAKKLSLYLDKLGSALCVLPKADANIDFLKASYEEIGKLYKWGLEAGSIALEELRGLDA